MTALSTLKALEEKWRERADQRERDTGIISATQIRDCADDLSVVRETVEQEMARLQHQEWRLLHGNIVEIGATNPSIRDYTDHWEKRAAAAEAEVERLRTAIAFHVRFTCALFVETPDTLVCGKCGQGKAEHRLKAALAPSTPERTGDEK